MGKLKCKEEIPYRSVYPTLCCTLFLDSEGVWTPAAAKAETRVCVNRVVRVLIKVS